MFCLEELNFIEESAKKDLKAIDFKIDTIVNEMARYGKQLSDLKAIRLNVQNILNSIEEGRENDEEDYEE